MKTKISPVVIMLAVLYLCPHYVFGQNFSRVLELNARRMNGPDVGALQKRLFNFISLIVASQATIFLFICAIIKELRRNKNEILASNNNSRDYLRKLSCDCSFIFCMAINPLGNPARHIKLGVCHLLCLTLSWLIEEVKQCNYL